MLQTVRKHIKPILFCLCGMLILYILMPMCFLRTLPFHVVHLDAEKVTAIEIYRCNEKKEIVQSIRIEDADEISELVQQLNDARFFFWILWMPDSRSDYMVKIEQLNSRKYYEVSPNSISAGAGFFTDMRFITDLLPAEG